ncbi:hypothetical protein LTS01_026164, partial [Friedmanniomyces endolithicus]
MNIGCDDEAVCKITPRLNTIPHEEIKPSLRPTESANGAASSAPKKVPADRMDTMSDSWDPVISSRPLVAK